MRGITASSVRWLRIQFWRQFILRLSKFYCYTAALHAVNTFELCWGCSCIKCHTLRVGTCRGLCAQGGVNVIFGFVFIPTVPIATPIRSCGVCSWYRTATAATQFWCAAPDVSVLLLPLEVPCVSTRINIILIIMPRNNKSQSLGTSEETADTLHAFLKVGKTVVVQLKLV